MSTIGFVQKQNDGSFAGHITTLEFDANVRFVANDRKNGDEPDYRVLARPNGDVRRRECELGGAWVRRSKTGDSYISLKLDDPSFTTALYANLGKAAGQDDDDTYAVIWNRS
jgi:uncharacterized protein (DUF736 family)